MTIVWLSIAFKLNISCFFSASSKKFLKKTEVEEEEKDEGNDDKKRNQVRKEFELKFEKKLQNIYLLK